ncbi:hypothetical protein CDD80_1314 [Ophiocordyceps camponoti-rufipedis]|uniref:Extracellular membrane protein CFEM domain-containing protein n=1 Tax=Ophiocordyceps camponoti-rufipedis TaxID=2004952 RepID=A0A2C5Z6S8_9HYPO|nr:hypothetical protein CDD80_1314 [Ophiocordyceps camponoti-rufipedis]
MLLSSLTTLAAALLASSPAAALPQTSPTAMCCCCNPGTSPAEARIVCSPRPASDGCFCAAVVCPEGTKTVYSGATAAPAAK